MFDNFKDRLRLVGAIIASIILTALLGVVKVVGES